VGGYLSIPILALAAVLQASVVPQIRFWDGAPDLVFLLVLGWAIHASLEESLVWALVGGILQDLLSVAPLGMSSVGMIVVVFVVNHLARQFHRVGPLLMGMLVLAGTLFQQMALWLMFAFLGFIVDFLDDFTYVVIPTMIYNFALIWPTYWLLRKIQRRFTDDRRIVSINE
jgi:rod shape-determining protein MreD